MPVSLSFVQILEKAQFSSLNEFSGSYKRLEIHEKLFTERICWFIPLRTEKGIRNSEGQVRTSVITFNAISSWESSQLVFKRHAKGTNTWFGKRRAGNCNESGSGSLRTGKRNLIV